MAWMTVSDMMSTARTAALRTGSGIRRRIAGSSTQSCRCCWYGIFAPPVAAETAVAAGADDTALRRSSVSKDSQLPTAVRLQGCCPAYAASTRADRTVPPWSLLVFPLTRRERRVTSCEDSLDPSPNEEFQPTALPNSAML
ncbi:hypothetical protein GCM10010207_72010 [Streptomyces atratus]|nr:hypothetical protein GCM10010207_72010 [Streptomyces atratus]